MSSPAAVHHQQLGQGNHFQNSQQPSSTDVLIGQCILSSGNLFVKKSSFTSNQTYFINTAKQLNASKIFPVDEKYFETLAQSTFQKKVVYYEDSAPPTIVKSQGTNPQKTIPSSKQSNIAPDKKIQQNNSAENQKIIDWYKKASENLYKKYLLERDKITQRRELGIKDFNTKNPSAMKFLQEMLQHLIKTFTDKCQDEQLMMAACGSCLEIKKTREKN